MYEQFTIEGFRGIPKVYLHGLKPINVFVGPNGVGKSTILEAFWIHAGGHPHNVLSIDNFRSVPLRVFTPTGETMPPWRTLFHDLDTKVPIVLNGRYSAYGMSWKLTIRHGTSTEFNTALAPDLWRHEDSAIQELTVRATAPIQHLDLAFDTSRNTTSNIRITIDSRSGMVSVADFPNYPRVPAYLLTSTNRSPDGLSQMFGELVLHKQDGDLVDALKIVNPQVDHLALTTSSSTQNRGIQNLALELVADVGLAEMLPVSLLGGGLQAVTFYVMGAILSQKGCLLIDEVGDGIHFSRLAELWRTIDQVAQKYHVQVMVTTHSRECIDALKQAVDVERVGVFSLNRRDGDEDINVVSWTGQQLSQADALDIEVR